MSRSRSKKSKLREGEFEVEKILDKRINNSIVEYFLKWKNYTEEYNTWEPEGNLNCPKLIASFEKIFENKKTNVEPGGSLIIKTEKINKGFSSDPKKIAEKIIGITNEGSEIKFLILWQSFNEEVDVSLVPAEYASSNWPNLVIKFYEEKIECNSENYIHNDGEIMDAFEYSHKPKEILGATYVNGKLMFLIEWEDSNDSDLVFAKKANEICPELVIKFYQTQLIFDD
jgi:chromobox protein 5